jgi:hypothetical protein
MSVQENNINIESKTINAINFLSLTKDKKLTKFLQFYILSQEAKLKSI